MKSDDIQSEIDRLEKQRTTLHTQIETFVIPCPDCKGNVKGVKTDSHGSAECPHCCAAITKEDVQSFVDESHRLWQALCATSEDISYLRSQLFHLRLQRGLKPWRKFIDGGFRRLDFTPALYLMLSHTFHHIAHGNDSGFWNVQFVNDEVILRTLTRMTEHRTRIKLPSNRHGRLTDRLEDKIVAEVKKRDLLRTLAETLAEKKEKDERAEYERLKKVYEVEG
jgi:hypothetical protein